MSARSRSVGRAPTPGPGAQESLIVLIGRLARRADGGQAPAPAPTPGAQVVIGLAAGVLAQFVFVTETEPDLEARLQEERQRLLDRNPGRVVRQHLVVVGPGTLPEPLVAELTRRDQVLYVREQDPEPMLRVPWLAPLAALARVGAQERADVLRRAFQAVWSGEPDPDLRAALDGATCQLAEQYLERRVVYQARRTAAMAFGSTVTPSPGSPARPELPAGAEP